MDKSLWLHLVAEIACCFNSGQTLPLAPLKAHTVLCMHLLILSLKYQFRNGAWYTVTQANSSDTNREETDKRMTIGLDDSLLLKSIQDINPLCTQDAS